MNKRVYVMIGNKKDGTKYTALKIHTGFREEVLSWNAPLCAEVLDISVKELMELPNGVHNIKIE